MKISRNMIVSLMNELNDLFTEKQSLFSAASKSDCKDYNFQIKLSDRSMLVRMWKALNLNNKVIVLPDEFSQSRKQTLQLILSQRLPEPPKTILPGNANPIQELFAGFSKLLEIARNDL